MNHKNNAMNEGKLIVFEGIDGSGKSTMIKLIYQFLQGKSIPIYLTKEPSESSFGIFVNKEISYNSQISESNKFFLIVLDRFQHICENNGIFNQVNNGNIVLCDRYYPSTYVYQGGKVSQFLIDTANFFVEYVQDFDLLIYFDVEPEIAIKRIYQSRQTIEIEETLENLRLVKTRYDTFLQNYKNKDKLLIIDANGSVEEIFLELKKKILTVLT